MAMKNIAEMDIFLRKDVRNLQIATWGKANMIKSVAELIELAATLSTRVFTGHVPSRSGFHALATGRHEQISRKVLIR
jgi:hypothetical protein